MLGLKVLLLGSLNLKECVCSSLGVVGTLPPPSGINKNMGSKLGIHQTIPCVEKVFEGNIRVGVLLRVGGVIPW